MGVRHGRMERDLKLGGYSASTMKIHLLYGRRFAWHSQRSPADFDEESEFRKF